MLSLIRKRMRGEKGFTLIELLVVIIIIAILAAIAIPTFLGQRQKAQDAAAKSIVRNALTAVESGYVDTRDFTVIDAGDLALIEPSIVFTVANGGIAAATLPTAEADVDAVDVSMTSPDIYAVGSVSLSDKTFGVVVNKSGDSSLYPIGNTFYVDGSPQDW